jgi:hypothetical protein
MFLTRLLLAEKREQYLSYLDILLTEYKQKSLPHVSFCGAFTRPVILASFGQGNTPAIRPMGRLSYVPT